MAHHACTADAGGTTRAVGQVPCGAGAEGIVNLLHVEAFIGHEGTYLHGYRTLMRLTVAMIQPRTGEGDCAKERVEGARVELFDAERLSAVGTLGMSGDQGGRLPLQEVLLKRGEELFRFSQRQAEVLDTLAHLIEDHHLMPGLFLIILCTHDELYLEPRGAVLLLG
jgi:hypothetical protein